MEVVAVRTTGIYCLPACSARPLPQNTTTLPSAAAAEVGGFRPCHRCRPYRVPLDAQVAGAPDLVCRAVALILDGALDLGGEEQLAQRVGLSARQLRRLFDHNLGVTPTMLARSARTHLARRLLDDTDLTVAQVAFAAGFGSLSQFGRDMRQVFHDTPSRLRLRRRRHDRLVADGGLTLRVTPSRAVDWPAVVAGLADNVVPGVESVLDQTYRRTVTVHGDVGVLELGARTDGAVELTAHLPHWEELVHIVQAARRLLGPGSRAPARPPVPRHRWNAWEDNVVAAVADVVGLPEARHCVGVLARQVGTPVGGLRLWGLDRTFPNADQLLAADLDALTLPAGAGAALHQLAAIARAKHRRRRADDATQG
ncbi:helix-turn-helix domain-containing protein [Georgenia sp. TF02-10]|uniref:helix-turn-helix domain-containing protein n=1 Tax=Georgenia sp. TF02-10 TaxID=2917725 RepID=UPI001FA6F216|nr:helix-turn-helix domain-containing protein [Georgenia sp. TF02-10]